MSYTDWTLSYKKILQAFPRVPSSSVRYLLYALFTLGVLGFLDAAYLTILHYRNAIPPCTIAHGCETVLTSQFSTLAGVPVSLVGAVYYLSIVVLIGVLLSVFSTETGRVKQFITNLLLLLTGAGLLVGIYLVFLQAFVLHAFCQYCLFSELIDFLLFDCAWWLWRKNG